MSVLSYMVIGSCVWNNIYFKLQGIIIQTIYISFVSTLPGSRWIPITASCTKRLLAKGVAVTVQASALNIEHLQRHFKHVLAGNGRGVRGPEPTDTIPLAISMLMRGLSYVPDRSTGEPWWTALLTARRSTLGRAHSPTFNGICGRCTPRCRTCRGCCSTMWPQRFAYPSALRRHERKHTGEKPYTCSICGMVFADISNLRRHKRRKHTGENLHTCSACEKGFGA